MNFTTSRAGERWFPDESAQVFSAIKRRIPIADIAKRHRRTVHGITSHIEQSVIRLYEQFYSVEQIQEVIAIPMEHIISIIEQHNNLHSPSSLPPQSSPQSLSHSPSPLPSPPQQQQLNIEILAILKDIQQKLNHLISVPDPISIEVEKVEEVDERSNMSVADWIAVLQCDAMQLEHVPISMQTDDLCMTAVKQNGLSLQFIHEQKYPICVEAVKQNPAALQFVREQTEVMCLEDITADISALQWVKNQTPDLCTFALQKDPMALQWIHNPTYEHYMLSLTKNGEALQFVKNQTEDLCLIAVKQSPEALQYVKNQTEDLCLVAVKQSPKALQFVKNQTEDLCLIAVSMSPEALQYVRDQTPKICEYAIDCHPLSVVHVRDQTPYLCIRANELLHKSYGIRTRLNYLYQK